MPKLYTPFMAKAGATIGNALMQRSARDQQEQQNQLAGSAYMGDPQALEQLMQLNPQLGMEIAQKKQQEQEDQAQKSLQEQARQQEQVGVDQDQTDREMEIRQNIAQNAIKLPYADANKYVQEQEKQWGIAHQPFTPEAYEHLNKIFAEAPKEQDPVKGIVVDGQVINPVDGSVIYGGVAKPAESAESPSITIPEPLISGLGEDLKRKVSSAYEAAGGGKEGVKIALEVIDKGAEQERRESSASIIKNSFPGATDDQLKEMQAAMDAAKTTESGLKEARKVFVEQERKAKMSEFQDRSVELLDRILNNPELEDVIGSFSGSSAFDFLSITSDAETQALGDIEAAKDILTGDNLKLMSGVLSKTDIEILANLSGSALHRQKDLNVFKADVAKLRDKIKGAKLAKSGEVATADVSKPEARQIGRFTVENES